MGALECFQQGSPVHAVMILLTAAATAVILRLGRRTIGFNRCFAAFLTASYLLNFIYYLRPNQISWGTSLPLHICDITGLMAVIAIGTGNRVARILLHFWGLALSLQALIFPMVQSGPAHCDFWLYWISHGGIVAAALYDLRVLSYRPTWHDWRLATLMLTGYAMLIIPLDRLMHVDYGFLGQTHLSEGSVIRAFGAWPQRLPVIWLTAVAMMALLKFRGAGQRELRTFSVSSIVQTYRIVGVVVTEAPTQRLAA